MYQCYAIHNTNNNFNNNPYLWLRSWLDWIYSGVPIPQGVMRIDNGVAEVPVEWLVEIYTLLNDPIYGPNYSGVAACAGKVGAY
jgi:hypothetical protein